VTLTLLCGAIVLFVPVPYPTNSGEREAALREAVDALVNGTKVLTPRGRAELPDRSFVTRAQGRVYYTNDTGVSDASFLNAGFKTKQRGTKIDLNSGDVLVSASYIDLSGHRSRHIQFSYVFASEGGLGYEIRIIKCVTRRNVVFVPKWIA
jgi:hypothetical protein